MATVGREGRAARHATRAWLDILRGAWMVLPAAPAPSEVVAMVREKGGQEEEEELAWLEALAGCLGAAVALAREQHAAASQVGGSWIGWRVSPLAYVLRVAAILLRTRECRPFATSFVSGPSGGGAAFSEWGSPR
jgi:hypothetical protein